MARGTGWLRHPWRLIALALLLLAAAVAAYPGPSQVEADEAWRVHPRWERRENPVPLDVAAVRAGAAIWADECATCHGDTGRGDGPRAGDLRRDTPDFMDPAVWGQTDGALAWKTLDGRRPMPGFDNELSEREIWQVIHYLRTLAPRPPATPMPQAVREGVSELLDANFDLVAALADMQVDGGDHNVVQALHRTVGGLSELDTEAEGIGSMTRLAWADFVTQLRDAADDLRQAGDADKTRRAFAAFSERLATGVASFGHAHDASIIRYECVEGFDGKSATWLEPESRTLRNPYLGHEHLRCVEPLQNLGRTQPD